MKKTLTLIFTISVYFCQSQSISVKYSEKIDFSNELNAMQMPDDLGGLSSTFIKEMISSSMEKPTLFELISNNDETLYHKIEDNSQADNSNISMTISGNDGIIYTNFKDQSYTQQSSFMSRKFLIDGKLKQYDWILTGNEKVIAGYKCKKALNLSSPKDTIIAWYTDELPHQYGPRQYNGLPGLILKLSADALEIEATEVSILKDKVEIKQPTKGKKVTQEEFEKIKEDKTKSLGGQSKGGSSVKVITM